MKLVRNMDRDGGGTIEFEEFVIVLEALQRTTHREVRLHSADFIHLLFRIFDQDDDGTVNQDEVSRILTEFGKWDQADLVKLFREMDADGGGEVSKSEFAEFVKKVLQDD